jgi:hypothetical protein
MEHYAGIDVSLDTVSVCIVNGTGKVLLEAKMVCDPEALVTWFQKLDFVPKRSLAIQAPANPGDQRRQPDPKISRDLAPGPPTRQSQPDRFVLKFLRKLSLLLH